jgi:hypothetical protein
VCKKWLRIQIALSSCSLGWLHIIKWRAAL